jgi:hypothetical protein
VRSGFNDTQGISDGIEELIDVALGTGHIGTTVPHFRHKTAALLLSSEPPVLDVPALLEAITNRLWQNWNLGQERRPRRGSPENWRWEKKPWISNLNLSNEKRCEKLIATTCGEEWVNQVPTASGLMNRTRERHCDIDLVHRVAPSEYELIELKYDDSTPLFAAFELLKYGMLYVFSRDFAKELGYDLDEKPVLAARVLHLRVLAPETYFAGFNLKWLQDSINAGLITYLKRSGYRMDFRFERMVWPHDGNAISSLASRASVYHP